jgi:hypothetical protein
VLAPAAEDAALELELELELALAPAALLTFAELDEPLAAVAPTLSPPPPQPASIHTTRPWTAMSGRGNRFIGMLL